MQTTPNSPQRAPGPQGHFLLGSASEFKTDILGAIEEARLAYGDLVRFTLGPRPVYAVCSPELAEEVLVKQRDTYLKMGVGANKPVGLQLLLGNGLLTNADYDSWLTQRRLMTPVFHRASIAQMSNQMVAAGERLAQRWQTAFAPGATMDVSQEMRRVTLDVIGRTMFSADVTSEVEAIGEAVSVGTEFIFQRNQNPLSPPLSIPTPANQQFKRTRAALDEVIYALLDERLASGAQHGDLLDMLITARDADTGEGMSRQQLRDEMATIFLAGHETTAHALAWAWVLLAQNPVALHRLQAEVDTVLQGREPTLADLKDLPYTAAVFDETLRLYPTAPVLVRRVARRTSLNGYLLEAGSQVFVSVYSIHRRRDLWDEPEAFKPERMLDGDRGRHRLAYLPFGAGQRKCIGEQFARMEGQLLLALLAQAYELRLAQDARTDYEVAITLRPRHGLLMTLHPRREYTTAADGGPVWTALPSR